LQQYKYWLKNTVGNKDVSFVLASFKDSEFVKVVRIEMYGFMPSRCFMLRGPANMFFKGVGFYTAELLCEEADIIFPI
jgi:hypothetical protein